MHLLHSSCPTLLSLCDQRQQTGSFPLSCSNQIPLETGYSSQGCGRNVAGQERMCTADTVSQLASLLSHYRSISIQQILLISKLTCDKLQLTISVSQDLETPSSSISCPKLFKICRTFRNIISRSSSESGLNFNFGWKVNW
jgi:hypothetical protein